MRIFEINNDLAEIERLINEISSYCNEHHIAEEAFYDIRLALEEAVSNIIKYGYEDHLPHTIHVNVKIEQSSLILEIVDDAKEFNPLEVSPPDLSLPVEKKPRGNLGIYLMRSIMDEIVYKRSAGKNILCMTKFVVVQQR